MNHYGVMTNDMMHKNEDSKKQYSVRQLGIPRMPNNIVIYIRNTTLTAVFGVGWSQALATCETSQVLLACVLYGFPRGSVVFATPTDWPVSYELK